MKLRYVAVLLVFHGFVVMPRAHGQAKEDPAHDELRALLKEIRAAYDPNQIEKVLPYLDENVVITWQNGKVTKNHKELQEFFDKMVKGPNKVVEKSTIDPEPDALSLLYNDGKTAIAYGHSKDHYLLTDGSEFNQTTRWSATLVKKDGKWKATNLHISVDIFDNPVLHLAMKRTGIWVGGIAGGGGLLLGLILGGIFFRSRPKAPATV